MVKTQQLIFGCVSPGGDFTSFPVLEMYQVMGKSQRGGEDCRLEDACPPLVAFSPHSGDS